MRCDQTWAEVWGGVGSHWSRTDLNLISTLHVVSVLTVSIKGCHE